MKDIKLLISSIFIIIAFFIWMLFSSENNKCKKEEKIYVNLEILKTKININNPNDNIIITANWEKILSWSIKLK